MALTAKDIDEKSELTIWTNTKYKAMTEVLEAGNIESMIDYLEYLDSVSVSPALLADMINELWSEAAVNADYNGLPFKEVSPAEVTSASALCTARRRRYSLAISKPGSIRHNAG